MSKPVEINKMIIQRIRDSEVDDDVRDFMIEVLQFEISNPKELSPRYKDEYLKMLQKHIRPEKSSQKP